MAVDYKSRILKDAEKYVLHGKTSQAINEYLKIVKADPNDVLTLNTIGDLYLRQGKTVEANGYFSQVAESYTRNNFLLKAIAVYRKILNSDPQNLAVNRTLASLYARHGSNVDARNQYLKVAEISAAEGKAQESLEAYEKVAELDPMNAAVQLKLADIQLANGAKEKARGYLGGAARALAKAGSFEEAISTFRRAMQFNPLDVAMIRTLFETCMQQGDVTPALEQLKQSLAVAPDNLDLLEMYGRACLSTGDIKSAEKAFHTVVFADEARFGLLHDVQSAFLKAGDLDNAATCLDGIFPILINRRATDRAIEAYNAVLAGNPSHIPALTRLSKIYSAINDVTHYVTTEGRLVAHYMDTHCPQEAIEHLNLILKVEPTGEQYLALHRQAFTEAFPGMPYEPPALPEPEPQFGAILGDFTRKGSDAAAVAADAPTMVEVDLLLNYGMAEKALELLRAMEARDPSDREVRQKLITIYRDHQPTLAAEQCLLLAVLERKAGNEEAAQKLLADARTLDAALVRDRADELLPQLKMPALSGSPGVAEAGVTASSAPMEVDLSEDLSEIFFQGSGIAETPADVEPARVVQDDTAEELASAGSGRMLEGSVADQLQEVDFYIRLGFLEEARAKLDEISKAHPGDPELPQRYQLIDEDLSLRSGAPAEKPTPTRQEPLVTKDELEILGQPQTGAAGPAEDHPAPQPEERTVAETPAFTPAADTGTSKPLGSQREAKSEAEVQFTDMFADLMEEVGSLTDQEASREDFETHFSLGIAYREMDLIDEAIKEFQGALKTLAPPRQPREVIQCCGMLSTCFLEKGMPKSAVRWCESGLGVPEISPHEAMALRYDMGVAFSIAGEAGRALECFRIISSQDPGYRDIAQKIDELRGGPGCNVS